MSTKGSSLNLATLLAIGSVPLFLGAAATGIVFTWQAWTFSQSYFQGDWAILAFAILLLETYAGTIGAGIGSLIVGIGIPAGAGSPVTLLEILACVVATSVAFGQGFWSLLRWSCDLLNLSQPIPTMLLVYLLLAPICIGVIFVICVVVNIVLSLVMDKLPGRTR